MLYLNLTLVTYGLLVLDSRYKIVRGKFPNSRVKRTADDASLDTEGGQQIPPRKRIRAKTTVGVTSFPAPAPVSTVERRHTVLKSGSVVWCCRCGTFVTGHRTSKSTLGGECPGPPRAGTSRSDRLR